MGHLAVKVLNLSFFLLFSTKDEKCEIFMPSMTTAVLNLVFCLKEIVTIPSKNYV